MSFHDGSKYNRPVNLHVLNYALEDLEQDLQTLRQVHEKESARAE